ncbi:MAG TPA: GNAT family N-acetyltransferase [Rhodocyclaceae bacterium]|nr:GNAT family N-acetyltransferase [Rhodocyclaceae bacterium]
MQTLSLQTTTDCECSPILGDVANSSDMATRREDAACWCGTLRSVREARDDALAIQTFMRCGLSGGDIDLDETLWIVDLAPGDGERAWHILQQLAVGMPPDLALRYLACCGSPAQYDYLANHPCLREAIRRGNLVLDCTGQYIPFEYSRNPLVVLAHEGISQFAQPFYAVHYGELFERAEADGKPEWRPLGKAASLENMLETYRRALNSAAFTLPIGAIEVLDRLLAVSDGRMMLRASGAGAMNMVQIRMGALNGNDARDLYANSHTNFEALARWHRAHGGEVRQSQHDDAGWVLHVALHDRPTGRLRACLDGVAALPHPDEYVALIPSFHDMDISPARCLAMLRAHDGDPRTLAALARQARLAAGQIQGTALLRWREAIAQTWAQYYPSKQDNGICMLLAVLAVELEDWSLAREILKAMLHAGQQRGACWHLLAECQQRTGAARAASTSLAQAMKFDAGNSVIREAKDCLDRRLKAWQERRPYRRELARDGLLVIEPLDTQHAGDMLYQYRDPQIGLMTRLPAFSNTDETQVWIAQRIAETQRSDYAVMHAERGFAGVVSAHWTGPDAFMHFWIGTDHQSRGLGTRSAQLLLKQLVTQGMRRIFTAVYPDNYRSIKTLQRLGFGQLPMKAAAPEDAMVFLAWALDDGEPIISLCDALRSFSRATGSVFQFPEYGVEPVAAAARQNFSAMNSTVEICHGV